MSKGTRRDFVQGTDRLLFCYFTDADAYFIGVFDHDSFASQTVIQIVRENWPHLISDLRMPGVTPYLKLSDEQTFELRFNGYNVLTTMRDGTTYMPSGGGVMWSGDSVTDTMKADRLLNWFHHIQDCIVRFIEADKDRGDPPYAFPVELRLRYLGNEPCVEDVRNGDVYRVAEDGVARISGRVWRASS